MVQRADVNSVLNQMRQVRAQMQQNIPQNSSAKETLAAQVEKMQQTMASKKVEQQGDVSVPNFQTMFANAINQVNQNQQVASDLRTRFEKGDPAIDLPEVMIAAQKSSVSFQAMNQVRNKLVEAYKDVMNMPV